MPPTSTGFLQRTACATVAALCTAAAAIGFVAITCASASAQTSVTTYHNDIQRTGWNNSETSLNAASVSGGTFNLQHSVTLDEQVDAQPLFVSNQSITGQTAKHNVVYAVTENNTVYAIDAATGAILRSRHLGTPVPQSSLPSQCNNNSGVVGITGTPVISKSANTMWLITYTYENSKPVYRLHALSLTSLADKVRSVIITASGPLADGSTYTFNAFASRQRTALMYANNSIYAAFASFCDQRADLSRGWFLGWNAATLAPFAANDLTNQTTGAPNNYYLTSIWMSGAGPATIDQNSPIFFVTSNADPSGTTYNPTTNLAESIVKISPDLSTVLDYFTPSDESSLDNVDNDFGAGGVLVLPVASGPTPRIAAAAGKDGNLYVVDRTNVGHYNPGGGNNILGTYPSGGCWCAPSYFSGADGVGRVVTSGGNNVIVWKTDFSGRATLTKESTSTTLSNGQDGGFFTSVSSNGTQAGSAVIWAVTRPTDSNPANVLLYAFSGADSSLLYSGVAGTWPNTGGNANLIPTIANGRVYVGSYRELAIFGLGSPAARQELAALTEARKANVAAANATVLSEGEHEIYGTVISFQDHTLMLRKRNGALVRVDLATATAKNQVAEPAVGRASLVRGRYNGNGTLVADVVLHAKKQAALWKADR